MAERAGRGLALQYCILELLMGGWLGGMEVTYMLHSYHGLWRDVARMRCNGERRDHGLGEIMGGVS